MDVCTNLHNKKSCHGHIKKKHVTEFDENECR